MVTTAAVAERHDEKLQWQGLSAAHWTKRSRSDCSCSTCCGMAGSLSATMATCTCGQHEGWLGRGLAAARRGSRRTPMTVSHSRADLLPGEDALRRRG